MADYFADSYYFLARMNPRDAGHQRALQFSRHTTGGIVTTAWVLTEVADALSKADYRQFAVQLYDALSTNSRCTIEPASQQLFEHGWQLYRDRPDKAWSLTDCISFVVMREHGLTEALTADHHFEQAGFVALLK